jgi:hypothetical protein
MESLKLISFQLFQHFLSLVGLDSLFGSKGKCIEGLVV